MFFGLQIDSTAAANAIGQQVPEEVKKTILDTILEGGWTMIPIGVLFIAAIYIIIERYLSIRKSGNSPDGFMNSVRTFVLAGQIDQAKAYCEQVNSPFSRMILKGISRLGTPLRDIETAIENVGTLEVYRLEKGLSILATIAGAAPMLGFFGTVLGMIGGFDTIANLKTAPTPGELAEPISTAMVTTAAGLLVGIMAYLGYNLLVNMVSRIIHKMESTSTDFIDLLQEPAS